jgi:hypothetical protein
MRIPVRTSLGLWPALFALACAACTTKNPYESDPIDLAQPGDLGAVDDLAGADLFGQFAPADHRGFPMLARASSGGLLSPMRLVVIVPSGDSMMSTLFAFADAAVTSKWFSAVTQEYGVAPPLPTAAHLTGAAFPSGTAPLADADVATYIQDTLAATANAPNPDGHTLYLVYLPGGVDLANNVKCAGPGPSGYHHKYGTAGDGFAVIQQCQGGFETGIEQLTIVGSHEIAEAATDSGLGWRMAIPASTVPVWMSDPWLEYEDSRITEDGDLCIDTRILEGDFYYQRAFSNAAAAAGGDPCLPPLGIPYYGATTAKPWYSAIAGSTLEVLISGWSTAPASDWIVRAKVQDTNPCARLS